MSRSAKHVVVEEDECEVHLMISGDEELDVFALEGDAFEGDSFRGDGIPRDRALEIVNAILTLTTWAESPAGQKRIDKIRDEERL